MQRFKHLFHWVAAAGMLVSVSSSTADNLNIIQFVQDSIGLVLEEDTELEINQPDDSTLEVSGSTSFMIENQSISIHLGTSGQPGLRLKQNNTGSWEVTELSLSIQEDLEFSGLTMKTPGDGLVAVYDRDSALLNVYGDLEVAFDGQTVEVALGDETTPGLQLTIHDDGSLKVDRLELDVKEDLTLFGLELKTDPDVGFDFLYDPADQRYEAYGGLTLTIEGQTLSAELGDEENPGLIVHDGAVTDLNLQTSEDLHIAGFRFEIPSSNPLDFQLHKEADGEHILVSGDVNLSDLWSVDLALGSEQHPGLKIVDGRWDLESLSIDIQKIDLGFMTMKEVKVRYTRGENGLDLEVDLDVAIPEIGEFTADVTIINGELHSVDLDYDATGTSEGLEIAETGVSIAHLGAAVTNIDQPASLGVDGSVGIEFGGQLEIAGETVTLIRVNGDVSVDPNHFYMKDLFLLGAYQPDNPPHSPWQAVLFNGDVIVDLNWSEDRYFIEGTIKIPEDYGLYLDAQLLITQRLLDALVIAGVRIPTSIPVIGGWWLDQIGVGLRIDHKIPVNDYAAAWTQVLFWTLGVEYKWNTGAFIFLDGAGVGNIVSQIIQDESGSSGLGSRSASMVSISKKFQIPEGATSISAKLDWGQTLENVQISANGPFRSSAELVTISTGDLLVESFEYDTEQGVQVGQTDLTRLDQAESVRLFIRNAADGISPIASEFPDGTPDELRTFEIILSYAATDGLTLDHNDLQIEVAGHYPNSSIDLPEIPASNNTEVLSINRSASNRILQHAGTHMPVNLKYWMMEQHSADARITLFVDDDGAGYDGRPIARDLSYGEHDPIEGGALTHTWQVIGHVPRKHDDYYLYARMDREGRSPVYSPYSSPFAVHPPIHGRVLDSQQDMEPLKNIRIYLDENGNGEFDAMEDPTTLTNSNGEYAFHNVEPGVHGVGLVPAPGYQHDPNSGAAPTLLETANFNIGDSVEIDFHINRLRSISGSVYVDQNLNGIWDAGEPGLGGVLLFLDMNENGIRDSRESRAHTMTDGTFRFHNVEANGGYTVRLLARPSHLTPATALAYQITTSDATYQDHAGMDFGIHPDAVSEISNTDYLNWVEQNLSAFPDKQKQYTADPDQDGFTNQTEFLTNTDPTNPNSSFELPFPVINPQTQEGMIYLTAYPGLTYQVETSSDLVTWTVAREIEVNSTQEIVVEITNLTEGTQQEFVRIRIF